MGNEQSSSQNPELQPLETNMTCSGKLSEYNWIPSFSIPKRE